MTGKRAAAYVRVSSEEQTEGWSLEGQERQIREFAERNGYKVVQVYRDETSGSKEKRPGLDQMLMDAHAGLFKAIIVVHTSRFFRNVSLARRYKDMLRNKLDIEVIFVNQPAIDPDDPTAFVMETINELFDEYYLHQLRFWTSLGKKTRAQRGMWNGTLPFGYMTDETTGMPVAHPKNAEGLKLAFEAYSTGRYTDYKIAQLLNREGYLTTGNWGERPFTKDTVNRMLRNRFYLGFTKYKGELFPGEHPALISQELFDKCLEVRAAKRKRPRSMGQKRRVYVLSGIGRCHECGLTLRAGHTSSGRRYRHTARDRGYQCVVPGMSVAAVDLEAEWSAIITAITLPDDWQQRIEQLAGDADERAAILRERDQVQEKLRRVKQLYKDLLIDDDEYRSTAQELQSRLSSLVLPSYPHMKEAGEYLENLAVLWEAATLAEKRDITRVMLKAMYVDIVGLQIVSIEPKPIFRMLFEEVCGDVGVELV